MQKIISKFFILLFVLYSSCENKTSRDKEGLIVYQENQISWVRNFEPLNPVSIPRWPTRGGIYESLYLNNPITTDWVPWLATNYKWENNNKKLNTKCVNKIIIVNNFLFIHATGTMPIH